ncbi:TipAS antibiotic-recognition domain-containing protein [Streptomyces sp. NPDC051742]|uniref:MerR family transcriptional regulator n=1 Tax=unclassified Streptomyces TaxID=2593676 RepID=UPI00344AB240
MTRAGETGLLPPARIGANGHRYYEEHQLLLLQQILVLRALGVGLPEIGRILSAQVDEVDALRGHHRRLLAERDRLDALAATVSRTIAELERSRKDGNPVTINRPENLFEGVQPSHYAENMRDFPELAEEVGRRAAAMSQADADAGHRERTARMIRLAELMAAGHTAGAGPVQAEIDAQYRALTRLRTVSAEEYRAIGRSCVDNDAWRTAYEAIAPGLAGYQRDAIEAYATTRLS